MYIFGCAQWESVGEGIDDCRKNNKNNYLIFFYKFLHNLIIFGQYLVIER